MIKPHEFKSGAVRIKTPHHSHAWRTLPLEVGLFRLKTGTTYLDREIEFHPITPIPIIKTGLGEYLEHELKDFGVKIDDEGDISVRLGPNKNLRPVLQSISWAYSKLLIPPKRDVKQNEVKKKA